MKLIERLKPTAVRLLLDVQYGPRPENDADYGHGAIPHDNAGNLVVRETIESGRPMLVGRFGSTELSCVAFRAKWRRGALRVPYPSGARRNAHVASGIYPTDDASLDRFVGVYLDAAERADVLGVWHNHAEHLIVRRCCPGTRLVHLDSLNMVIQLDPWTEALAGRRVLVVHPFVHTIAQQYREKRTLLFSDPRVLPEFTLLTYAPVQTIAGNVGEFASWFDALEHMAKEIARIDFDIAIIGAGAYGLPLGAHVKAMGRQAVHLGGNTQLLFGIKGRRWEEQSPDIACLFNEHWVRPAAAETPHGHEKVEGGCYW